MQAGHQLYEGYAVTHFNAEEQLQAKIGFPEAEAHRKLHQSFLPTLHELELDLIRSDYSPEKMDDVLSFLTKWWIYHIIKEDKKMAAYTQDPGT